MVNFYPPEFPKLNEYVEVMNQEIFPDWEEQLRLPAKHYD